MSSDPVLEVVGLGKRYPAPGAPLRTLLAALSGGLIAAPPARPVLADVTFSLAAGETLGVLGRNGAGKTTLLHLLAGTVRASAGSIRRRGRLGMLIALGAGFDREATGMDNIRAWGELDPAGPFSADELAWIVDFCQLGEALARPVRTYSQGMQLRLGFAVATARRPDALIIDEVMAVGDIFFRQRCHEHIASMVGQGTAAVLVTHDTSEAVQFCRRALVLDQGRTVFQGEVREAAHVYLRLGSHLPTQQPITASLPASCFGRPWPEGAHNFITTSDKSDSTRGLRLSRCAITDLDQHDNQVFRWGSIMRVHIEIENPSTCMTPIIGWSLSDDRQRLVTGTSTHMHSVSDWPGQLPPGSRMCVAFDICMKAAFGEYTLNVLVAEVDSHIFENRRSMPPELLASHIIRHENRSGVCAIAIVPDLEREGCVMPHHGQVYLPTTLLHHTETSQ